MEPDYYSLLGVEKTATAAELKAAYHREAKKYHPDRNTDNAAAEERFKLVAEAWRVLGDADRRADYDARLARSSRYKTAPELLNMPHRTRVSRHSHERRREERGSRRERVSRPTKPRLFLINRRKPMGLWGMVAVYVFCVLMILPPLIRVMHPATLPPTTKDGAQSEKSAEELRRRVQKRAEALRQAAEQGDADAQMRYGICLYNGLGIPVNRLEARDWWQKSAAQGNADAAEYLSQWSENPESGGDAPEKEESE